MAQKVHNTAIMQFLRSIRALFGLLVVLAVTAVSGGAAVTLLPAHHAGTTSEELLSLFASDFGWDSGGDLVSTASRTLVEAGVSGGKYRLTGDSDSGVTEEVPPAPLSSDIVRHRGFPKVLLIIIVCGGLIRFLTSPTYLKFIADALDPKAF